MDSFDSIGDLDFRVKILILMVFHFDFLTSVLKTYQLKVNLLEKILFHVLFFFCFYLFYFFFFWFCLFFFLYTKQNLQIFAVFHLD